MKKKVYSAMILLSLASPALAAATEDQTEAHGTIEIGGQAVHTNGDKARFQEFRDVDDSIFGAMQLEVQKGAYHFQFDADKVGQDDQSYYLQGGEYGNFKYKFNYSDFTHNYGFDAVSPATGIGTTRLVFPLPATAAATPVSQWSRFDYSVDHKSYGGEFELSLHSPFYVKAGVERREDSGSRPYSAYLRDLAFANRGPAEIPEPISTTTDTLNLKAGYLGKNISTSLSGMISSFSNDNKFLYYDDLAGAAAVGTTVDRTEAFAPDNDYKKVAADLTWRDLPLKSVLAIDGSYAHLTNSYSTADLNLNGTTWAGASGFTSLNRTTFDGDIDYTSASVALASNPIDKLDTKIYYRYLDRDNKSSIISYDSGNTDNTDRLMSYEKNDTGIDAGYRLPQKTRLEAGYEYLKLNRSTPEGDGIPANSTTDNSVYVGVKNSALDWLTAKVRYKHLKRDSDTINTAETPFYYQDQSRNEWMVGFDLAPVDTLDLGLDYTYKRIDYDASVDSRQDDKRHSVYLDATWRPSKRATLSGFVGYETVKTDTNRVANSTTTNSATLTTSPYSQQNDDDFWSYGLAARVAATEKLTLDFSWQHQRSDGQVDFSNPNFLANTASDDYTKKTLEAKATYAFDPKFKMTLGYLYERFTYEDVNYTGFQYQPVAANQTFYSGLYAAQNYDANVVYVMAAYGF